MTVLIDSWAWIEYFKGSSYGIKSKDFIEGNEEIITSSINVAEVYNFLLKNNIYKQNLIDFMIKTSFVIVIDTNIALQAAKYKFEKKFGMADAIVLATAKFHNAKIITGDDDFKDEENVTYIGK